MNKAFENILEKLDETDLNDIQIVVREVLLKYGFPYESVVQDEVWDALDGLSTNKFAKKIVQEVAEEYNGGWIPCSERLPEESGKYLTTLKIYFVPDHVDEIDNYVGVKISHYSTRCGWFDEEVIAWQSLPEPYKESD